VIPKATSKQHIRDNWKSRQLELDEEDIRKIDSIQRKERQIDPGFSPW
jgi:2,5-diketo-D-gluconate reductase B